MEAADVVRLYFDAWNRHDPAAIVALFTADGLYLDPYVPAGVGGKALADYCAGVFTNIPDTHFEIITLGQTDPQTIVVEWRMHGAGGKINFPGADFICVEGDLIRRVQGYYDTAIMARQRKSV